MSVNIINRQDTEALIREQVASTIFQDTSKQFVLMGMAYKPPSMTSKQARIRVLDFLPTTYWVDGDTGMKQTTHQIWDSAYLTAGELTVIVPTLEAVPDDAGFDIMGEIISRVNEATGQCVDSAIISEYNRPAKWQSDIIILTRQAGSNVADISGKDLYDKLLGEGGVFSKVEEDGYMVGGCLSTLGMRVKPRGLRATDETLIPKSDVQGSIPYAFDGAPMYFSTNGNYDKNIAQLVAGDFKQAVCAICQDITVKILDQGIIQNPVTKEIIYDLAWQDMIALRVISCMGWTLLNATTRLDENHTGCAFAYLEPAVSHTVQKVTLTIKDGSDEGANPVERTRAGVNGVKLMIGADGIVEFNLREGTYPVKTTRRDHITVNDTMIIVKDVVTKDVALIRNQQEREASSSSLRRC